MKILILCFTVFNEISFAEAEGNKENHQNAASDEANNIGSSSLIIIISAMLIINLQQANTATHNTALAIHWGYRDQHLARAVNDLSFSES